MGKKKKQEKVKKRKDREEKLQNQQSQKKKGKEAKAEKAAKKDKKGNQQAKVDREDSRRIGCVPEKAAKSDKEEKRQIQCALANPDKKDSRQAQQQSGRDAKEVSFHSGFSADVFRAIGDESRMQILDLLKENELCAGELLKSLSIVQSTLSHHMKILVESGLVTCRKQGKWSYYSINEQMLKHISTFVLKWSQVRPERRSGSKTDSGSQR